VKSVSRFESNLLLILRCLLRREPLDRTLPLIHRKVGRPRCLSRAAVELVQDSLSRGLPLLAARGGWRKERFLRNEQVVTGRVWERSTTEHRALHFSVATLEWLIWLTAVNPADERKPPAIDPADVTTADRLFFYLAFDRLEDARLTGPLLKQRWFAEHALLWLAFPDRFAEHGFHGESSFDRWLRADTVWFLEALQDRLADRWAQIEINKRETTDWRKLQAVGAMQRRVLERFLTAVEKAGRKDLARFLLRAASGILDGGERSSGWFPRLDLRELRLADRADVYRDGLAFLQSLSRLRQWEQSARNVGYYDDGYAASQLWKSDWEAAGGTGICAAAAEIIRCTLPFQV
jgi:FtsH ternary system domain X6